MLYQWQGPKYGHKNQRFLFYFISTKAKVLSCNKNIKLQVGFVSKKIKNIYKNIKNKKVITSGLERVY